MTDYILLQIVNKSRDAKNGGFGVLSTGEKLAAALVLNRADWLAGMDYTMAEAIERVGADWLARIPEAARLLENEDSAEADEVELSKRREAVAYGRASTALEGFQPSPEYIEAAERFAAGEMTREEFAAIAPAGTSKAEGDQA